MPITAGQTRFFCTHFQEDERHDRLLRKRQAEGLPVLLLLRQTRLYAELVLRGWQSRAVATMRGMPM